MKLAIALLCRCRRLLLLAFGEDTSSGRRPCREESPSTGETEKTSEDAAPLAPFDTGSKGGDAAALSQEGRTPSTLLCHRSPSSTFIVVKPQPELQDLRMVLAGKNREENTAVAAEVSNLSSPSLAGYLQCRRSACREEEGERLSSITGLRFLRREASTSNGCRPCVSSSLLPPSSTPTAELGGDAADGSSVWRWCSPGDASEHLGSPPRPFLTSTATAAGGGIGAGSWLVAATTIFPPSAVVCGSDNGRKQLQHGVRAEVIVDNSQGSGFRTSGSSEVPCCRTEQRGWRWLMYAINVDGVWQQR
nr:hypothetical protein Iba_chr08fCG0020 [Ipomoea batatas]